MFPERYKKWIKRGIIILILLPIFLVLFVLPLNQGMIKDGGTRCYGPVLGVYEYRKVHGLTSKKDKDGNQVYLVGSEFYIFGCKVHSNTHYEAGKTGRRVEEDEMTPMISPKNDAVNQVTAEIDSYLFDEETKETTRFRLSDT